jgi:hypothetical protein
MAESGGHEAPFAVWVCVFVIIAGTIMGGIALIFWNWPVFFVGVGMFVLGAVAAAGFGIMNAVTEFGPGPGETEQATRQAAS